MTYRRDGSVSSLSLSYSSITNYQDIRRTEWRVFPCNLYTLLLLSLYCLYILTCKHACFSLQWILSTEPVHMHVLRWIGVQPSPSSRLSKVSIVRFSRSRLAFHLPIKSTLMPPSWSTKPSPFPNQLKLLNFHLLSIHHASVQSINVPCFSYSYSISSPAPVTQRNVARACISLNLEAISKRKFLVSTSAKKGN